MLIGEIGHGTLFLYEGEIYQKLLFVRHLHGDASIGAPACRMRDLEIERLPRFADVKELDLEEAFNILTEERE